MIKSRALRFGYDLSLSDEQRRKALRASIRADTNIKGVVCLKRTRDMIEEALIQVSNKIYRETGCRANNISSEYYKQMKIWEKRANRDYRYLNEWGRDYYKVKKDAEAGRIYLITRDDIMKHLSSDYNLKLMRIFNL
jgi:hypothetical protein